MKNPLSRTEHRLRLAFDPEYEAKWNELIRDRKSVRVAVIKSMRTRSLLVLAIGLGGTVYLLTRSWPYSFLAPPLAWAVESAVYMWISDRQKRSELGIK